MGLHSIYRLLKVHTLYIETGDSDITIGHPWTYTALMLIDFNKKESRGHLPRPVRKSERKERKAQATKEQQQGNKTQTKAHWKHAVQKLFSFCCPQVT